MVQILPVSPMPSSITAGDLKYQPGEVLEISPYTNRHTIKERDRLEQDRFSSSCGCHGAREMGVGGGDGWLVTIFFHSVFKLDTRFSLHVICRCSNGAHVSVGHPTRKLVVQYLGGRRKKKLCHLLLSNRLNLWHL